MITGVWVNRRFSGVICEAVNGTPSSTTASTLAPTPAARCAAVSSRYHFPPVTDHPSQVNRIASPCPVRPQAGISIRLWGVLLSCLIAPSSLCREIIDFQLKVRARVRLDRQRRKHSDMSTFRKLGIVREMSDIPSVFNPLEDECDVLAPVRREHWALAMGSRAAAGQRADQAILSRPSNHHFPVYSMAQNGQTPAHRP